MKKHQL